MNDEEIIEEVANVEFEKTYDTIKPELDKLVKWFEVTLKDVFEAGFKMGVNSAEEIVRRTIDKKEEQFHGRSRLSRVKEPKSKVE